MELLGDVYLNMGVIELNYIEDSSHLKRAGEYFSKAEAFFRAIGIEDGLATSLVNRAAVLQLTGGNYEQEVKMLNEAKEIFEETKSPYLLASCIKTMSMSERNVGRNDLAVGHLVEALEIAKENYYYDLMGAIQLEVGQNQHYVGFLENAEDHLYRAKHIFEDLGDKKQLAYALGNLGVVAEKKRDFKLALNRHGSALNLFEGIGFNPGIANESRNVGNLIGILGIMNNRPASFEEASSRIHKAIDIHEQFGDRYAQAVDLKLLAGLNCNWQKYTEAVMLAGQALLIYEEINNQDGIQEVKNLINTCSKK